MTAAAPGGRERAGLGVLVLSFVLAMAATLSGPGLGLWVFEPLQWVPLLALPAFAVALFISGARPASSLSSPASGPLVDIAVALLGFGLCWFLRDNSRSGDFGRIIYDLREGVVLLKAEPLSPWMMGHMASVVSLGGELTVTRLQFTLCAWGALGFWCLWRIAIELTYERPGLRWWAFAPLALSGSNALLLAHVETYTFSGVCMLLAILLGLRHLRGAGPSWPVILAWTAACAFHMQVLVLAPAMLMLTLWGRARDAAGARQSSMVAWLGWAAAMVGIQRLCEANPPPYPQHFGGSDASMFVPFDGWFASGHLLGVFNELFLFAPYAFAVLLAFGVGWSSTHLRQRPGSDDEARRSFLAVCVGGWLVLLWAWNPDLGAWRDWDLFAGVGWPLAAWSVSSTLRADRAGARRWLVGLALLSLARTLPFVWANHLGPIPYLR